jgi:hypothetical protein
MLKAQNSLWNFAELRNSTWDEYQFIKQIIRLTFNVVKEVIYPIDSLTSKLLQWDLKTTSSYIFGPYSHYLRFPLSHSQADLVNFRLLVKFSFAGN